MKNRTSTALWSMVLVLMSGALPGGALQPVLAQPYSLAGGKVASSVPGAANSSAIAATMAVISHSANNAQQRCNDLGHDNMDEYVSCTDALVKAVKGKAATASQQRLGILYFGWVGAEHWLRVGLPGSQEAAKRYFRQFRPLQQEMALTDQTLCAALAGDCTVRLAQVAAAVREYGAQPASK